MPVVWEWGSEFDLLAENCEKYASSAWRENTVECAILLDGIERNEGITYSITGYAKRPDLTKGVASRLLSAALGTKIRYCSVELAEQEFPKQTDVMYREEQLAKRVEFLLQKVGSKLLEGDESLRSRVGQTGKLLEVDWTLSLTCYVRSPETPYLIDCEDSVLDVVLPFAKKLASKLGEVVGYTLYDRVEDPITIDVEEDEGHIYVTAIERLESESRN
jgi:gamma-glutamylcyclotransferase (GGCT)/AIG2-like uncharacterized protein YtfP